MGIKYFNLTDGSMEFHEDRLLISDKAKRERNSILFSTFSFLFLGIAFIIKGQRHQDKYWLLIGFATTIFWILLLIKRRKDFQKIDNEIYLTNIEQVTFSTDKVQGNSLATIKTKEGRQRKIKLIQENNQDFEFKALLGEYKVKVD